MEAGPYRSQPAGFFAKVPRITVRFAHPVSDPGYLSTRMSGPELQREPTLREVRIPTVFISAQTDEHLHASLRAEGAIACRPKPFDERTQLQAVGAALREP